MIRPGDEPIPGYRVEEMLGRGQYGEVWRATTPGRSSVALKFLDMTGRRGWKEFRAVQRVKQIRHAHLMPIVAIWLLDADGQILTDDAVDSLAEEDVQSAETLSFETVESTKQAARMVIATLLGDISLRDRLNDCLDRGLDGIPRDELIGYMQEAAKGIDYLNSVQHDWAGGQVGVQHCDIKPDNVMLMGGSIVICDFGVAQVFADAGDDARATSLSGSPAYMAPEAFEARPSAASDQYSLAVMYYELRTGELPLDAENFAAAYDSHRTGGLDFSFASEEEETVLRRATSLDPGDRFATAVEFVEALREKPAVATPRQRSPWPWVAATLLACGFAAIGVYAWQTKAVETTLHFDAPGAHVVVNGQEYTTESDGSLIVKTPIDKSLEIAAVDNEDRRDSEWTIAAADLVAGQTHEFKIPYTAAYHAEQAKQLLADGEFAAAVDAYSLAVKEEPDRYARFPEPAVRETAGLLWGDCLQLTPSGDGVVTGSKDGAVRLWKVDASGVADESTELHRREDSQIEDVAVTDILAASACDMGDIWISHLTGNDDEQLIKGDGAEAEVSLTGDGAWLVAGLADELNTRLLAWDIAAWDVAAGKHAGGDAASSSRELGNQPGEFPKLIGCAGSAVVAATKDVDAIIWKWDVDSPDDISPDHVALGRQQNDVLSLSASADGSTIAYAGVANSTDDVNEAAIVEVETGKSCRLGSRQSDSILTCALDAAGEVLATAERFSELDETGTVWLWQPNMTAGVAASQRVLRYDKSLGDVTALAVSIDAEWIAAGHEGGGVSLWRTAMRSESPLATFGRGDRVVAVRITPDQRWLISGAVDGRIQVFDLRRLELIRQACERAGVQPDADADADRVTLRPNQASRSI